MNRNDYALLFCCHEPTPSFKILVNTIKEYGWEVDYSFSIDDLFQKLSQKPQYYDFLIIDVLFPVPQECNHISFTLQELKEMRDGLNTGVVCAKKILREVDRDYSIILTSLRDINISSDPELKGYFCDYLRKPFMTQELDQLLCDMIGKYHIEYWDKQEY